MENTNDQLVSQLTYLGNHLTKEADNCLAEFNLNQQQLQVLAHINEFGPISQKEVSLKLGLNKAHVSKIIKKITKLGYLQGIGQDEDARLKLWTASFEGIQISAKATKAISQFNQNWQTNLRDAEVNQLVRVLSKITIKEED